MTVRSVSYWKNRRDSTLPSPLLFSMYMKARANLKRGEEREAEGGRKIGPREGSIHCV